MSYKIVHIEADIRVSSTYNGYAHGHRSDVDIKSRALDNLVRMHNNPVLISDDEFITISWDEEPLTASLTREECEELRKFIEAQSIIEAPGALMRLRDFLGRFE